jgi:hypothetical protein
MFHKARLSDGDGYCPHGSDRCTDNFYCNPALGQAVRHLGPHHSASRLERARLCYHKFLGDASSKTSARDCTCRFLVDGSGDCFPACASTNGGESDVVDPGRRFHCDSMRHTSRRVHRGDMGVAGHLRTCRNPGNDRAHRSNGVASEVTCNCPCKRSHAYPRLSAFASKIGPYCSCFDRGGAFCRIHLCATIPGAGTSYVCLVAFGIASGVWSCGPAGNLVGGFGVDRSLSLTVAAASLILGIATISLALFGSGLLISIAMVTIWGFAFGGVPIGLQTWMARAAPDHLESVGGLFIATFQIAIAIGSIAGGLLTDRVGVQGAVAVGGAVALTAGVLILSLGDYDEDQGEMNAGS